MTITVAQADSLVHFARYCDECHTKLAPYTRSHDDDFKPPLDAFGGSGGGASGFRAIADGHGSSPYPELVYRYTPMAPEEWEKATGKKLDHRYDPHRMDEWGDEPTSSAQLDAVEDWNSLYSAGGKREGGDWIESTGGDAPWAAPLKKTWDAAVNDRLWEASVVREELEFVMRTLIKVSHKYPEADLENSVKIAKYAEDK